MRDVKDLHNIIYEFIGDSLILDSYIFIIRIIRVNFMHQIILLFVLLSTG